VTGIKIGDVIVAGIVIAIVLVIVTGIVIAIVLVIVTRIVTAIVQTVCHSHLIVHSLSGCSSPSPLVAAKA